MIGYHISDDAVLWDGAPTFRERAHRLIERTYAYYGNHGFNGHARETWNDQRSVFLSVLLEVMSGFLTERTADKAISTLCPQEAARGSGDFQAGTIEGDRWVMDVLVFVGDIRNTISTSFDAPEPVPSLDEIGVLESERYSEEPDGDS